MFSSLYRIVIADGVLLHGGPRGRDFPTLLRDLVAGLAGCGGKLGARQPSATLRGRENSPPRPKANGTFAALSGKPLPVRVASLSGSPVRPRVSRFQQGPRDSTGDPDRSRYARRQDGPGPYHPS